jgi:hypothetical protein
MKNLVGEEDDPHGLPYKVHHPPYKIHHAPYKVHHSFFGRGLFFSKIFPKFFQNFEKGSRFSKKFSRGSKKDFFPNFYDSFSMATQVVFLIKKKGPKKKKVEILKKSKK